MDFKAIDCYFLDKAPDLLIEGEMTIDRSTHEGMDNSILVRIR